MWQKVYTMKWRWVACRRGALAMGTRSGTPSLVRITDAGTCHEQTHAGYPLPVGGSARHAMHPGGDLAGVPRAPTPGRVGEEDLGTSTAHRYRQETPGWLEAGEQWYAAFPGPGRSSPRRPTGLTSGDPMHMNHQANPPALAGVLQ